jgi:hypothetical protein
MTSGGPVASGPLKLTSTQIGKVGETIVAAQLMLTTKGRLSPFLPIADDGGIDLLVYDKATRRSLAVQVKGRLSLGSVGSRPVQFDVRRATFPEGQDSFLLAILLDIGRGEVQRAWLIPMSELAKVSQVDAETFSITPSPSDTSRDRYTPYRCHAMGDVAARLIACLDVGENGTVGTVTAATVNEAEKATYLGITDTNGNAQILRVAMSDAEIAEYTEFRDAYFGRVVPGPFRPKDNFELFEWLMETHKTLPREKILEQFAAAPNRDALTAMSDPDLRAAYCEAMVAAMEAKRPSNPAEPAHATSARRSEGVARGGFIE